MFSLNQQMTGQGARRAMRSDGVNSVPVPSFVGFAPISSPAQLPVRSRTGSLIPSHRHAARPVDAAFKRQPKPSSQSDSCDGHNHRKEPAHALGEISQGLGNV